MTIHSVYELEFPCYESDFRAFVTDLFAGLFRLGFLAVLGICFTGVVPGIDFAARQQPGPQAHIASADDPTAASAGSGRDDQSEAAPSEVGQPREIVEDLTVSFRPAIRATSR